MFHKVILFILCFFQFVCLSAQTNPVISGDWSDAAFLRMGKDYYTVRSTVGWNPGLAIMHSEDLINWEVIGNAFRDNEELSLGTGNRSGGVWAADMIYNPNTSEYQIYTTIARSISLFCSKKPEGPYTFEGKIDCYKAIDPGVFVDTDNRIYLVLKKGGILHELSKDGRKVIDQTRKMKNNRGKLMGGEGPEIYHVGKYYYYFSSHGGTGRFKYQKIDCYRSKQLDGPWEPHPENPIKSSPHTSNTEQQAPGHGELIKTQNGEWYFFYNTNGLKHPTLARPVCLEKVSWKNDWWYPNSGPLVPKTFEKPNLPKSDIRFEQSDDFEAKLLDPKWFFHTNSYPDKKAWSLKDLEGSIALRNYTGQKTMEKQFQRMPLQRFVSEDFEITTKLNFKPAKDEFSGLVLHADGKNYIQFGLKGMGGGKYEIQVFSRACGFNFVTNKQLEVVEKIEQKRGVNLSSTNEIYLKITIINPETAHFSFSIDNKKWHDFRKDIFIGRGQKNDLGWISRYWTGATFGLFLDRGNTLEKENTAYFDWIKVVDHTKK